MWFLKSILPGFKLCELVSEPQWFGPVSTLRTTPSRWMDPSGFLARNAQCCLWLACIYFFHDERLDSFLVLCIYAKYIHHVFRQEKMRKAVKFNCRLLPAEKNKYLKEIFMALVVRWTTRHREIDEAHDKGQVPVLGCFYYTLYFCYGSWLAKWLRWWYCSPTADLIGWSKTIIA